ncbi:MAG: YceI family protein [Deltaproteobacteria bacterium]|nr:YceI family protein [Deltaproteobacteria bacterium]
MLKYIRILTLFFFTLIPFLLTGFPVLASKGSYVDIENYYILQIGNIVVQGKSNFFDFKGEAIKHEGKLVEEDETYTGRIILRFKDLHFNLPLAGSIITDPKYMDVKHHPEIEINLDHFKPEEKPTSVKSMLSMNGVTKPISIATTITNSTPVVKVNGSFTVKQTDYKIIPYKAGLVKVVDELNISFLVYFCETHDKMPPNDYVSPERIKQFLVEDNITIITDDTFYGCEELRPLREQGLLK